MGDEIQTLRNRLRMSLVQRRIAYREIQMVRKRVEFENDDEGFTRDQIIEIIRKLRGSGPVTVSDLRILRAYFSNRVNIPLFFRYNGGVRGLVGEMTGSDSDKQLLAGECICHLTLGSVSNCLSIIKDAGAYLMTFLVNPDLDLAQVCAYALGNISCSSRKATDKLKELGLLKVLIALIGHETPRVKVPAMYALSHLLNMDPSITDHHELIRIVELISDLSNLGRYHAKLLYVASTNGATLCSAFVEHKILTKITHEIIILVSQKEWANKLAIVVFLLRTAANIIYSDEVMNNERVELLQDEFVEVLRKLLACQIKSVTKTLLWFFGNIENHYSLPLEWKINYLNKFSDLIALCI